MIKKIIAILLAVILSFAATAPAFAAFENECDLPVVTVEGMGNAIYKEDGTQVTPLNPSEVEAVMDNMFDFHKEYPRALLTDDWTAYADAVYNIFVPVYKDFYLDNNGDPRDGTAVRWNMNNAQVKFENYGVNDYVLHWDWRLDPCVVADTLNEYIDIVLEKTGKSKVNLIGRCLGSTVAAAYLYEYGTEKIESCIMYVPTVGGSLVCEKLYSNQLSLNPDSIDRFVQNYLSNNNLLPEPLLQPLVVSLVTLLNYTGGLDLALGEAERIYSKISELVLPRVCRISYASFPSFWAMVDDDADYEAAKKFIFNGVEDEYAGLISKIDHFHYDVKKDFGEQLRAYKNQGLDIAVIAKYGFDLPPIFDNSEKIISDGVIELDAISLGATCCSIGETFSDEYIAKAEKNGTAKYISPDKQIDASTCVFPDATWIIKNIQHSYFPSCIDGLMLSFFRSGGKMTVDSNPDYPQYMFYNESNNTLVTYAEAEKEDFKYTGSFFEALTKFFRALREYLSMLISKRVG